MTTQQTITFMLLMHLVADYTLQGWLAQGKQLSWWKNLGFKDEKWGKYKFDYTAALACHALYWSILVCLPFWSSEWLAVAIFANTIVHAVVDDLKANLGKLNLIQDQLIHVAQIAVTFALLH